MNSDMENIIETQPKLVPHSKKSSNRMVKALAQKMTLLEKRPVESSLMSQSQMDKASKAHVGLSIRGGSGSEPSDIMKKLFN